MKKLLTIELEVDMENPAVTKYAKPENFFNDEVETVLDKVKAMGYREYSKHRSETGSTENGSQFSIVLEKIKEKSGVKQD